MESEEQGVHEEVRVRLMAGAHAPGCSAAPLLDLCPGLLFCVQLQLEHGEVL
ncbi:putative UPF0481 protein [Iris pallida]|uniref:UPF0481 protein n=1 Tax=Iris pallida TaxID=29817 RepID=A0AAX6GKE9_IRIPA|nr:putative UPF0481 protein [Iris pallida]